MQQLNIFYFDPKVADWKETKSKEHTCEVLALIPKEILSPFERKKIRIGTDEWHYQQDLWSAYVTAIANGIPYTARSKNDINGWSAACALLEEHRGSKNSVKLKFNIRYKDMFFDSEIIEYLID